MFFKLKERDNLYVHMNQLLMRHILYALGLFCIRKIMCCWVRVTFQGKIMLSIRQTFMTCSLYTGWQSSLSPHSLVRCYLLLAENDCPLQSTVMCITSPPRLCRAHSCEQHNSKHAHLTIAAQRHKWSQTPHGVVNYMWFSLQTYYGNMA